MQGSDDVTLLDRWAAGEAAAGAELFARYFDAVYRFFRNKVDSDAMEELVQQTFLACTEGRDAFRRASSFRTYLFQIARFRLYAHYRARRREGAVDPLVTSVRDLGTSPTGILARKELHLTLLAALRALPLDLQIATELRYWEQLTERELAEVLGIPRGTVAGRLRRAHELLKAAVAASPAQHAVHADVLDDVEAWATDVRVLLMPGGA